MNIIYEIHCFHIFYNYFYILCSVTQNKGKQVKVKGNLVVYNNVEALLTLDHNIAAQNVARQVFLIIYLFLSK